MRRLFKARIDPFQASLFLTVQPGLVIKLFVACLRNVNDFRFGDCIDALQIEIRAPDAAALGIDEFRQGATRITGILFADDGFVTWRQRGFINLDHMRTGFDAFKVEEAVTISDHVVPGFHVEAHTFNAFTVEDGARPLIVRAACRLCHASNDRQARGQKIFFDIDRCFRLIGEDGAGIVNRDHAVDGFAKRGPRTDRCKVG